MLTFAEAAASLSKRHTMQYHGSKAATFTCVQWSASGQLLAAGSEEGLAFVWKVGAHKKESVELKGHSKKVTHVCFCPANSSRLATAGHDYTLRIWDTRTGICVNMCPTKSLVTALAWSPDGKRLAVATKKCELKMHNPATLQKPRTVTSHHRTHALAWASDSQHLLCGREDGELRIYGVEKGSNRISAKELLKIRAHTGVIHALALDSSGKHLASAGADAISTLWDARELVAQHQLVGIDTDVRAVSFNCNSQFLASGGDEKHIDVTFITTGSTVVKLHTTNPVTALDWHPSQLLLAYVANDLFVYGLTSV